MTHENSIELGATLLKVANNPTDSSAIQQLLEALKSEENRKFIKKLADQSQRSFLRQVLKIDTDYYASEEAIEKAREDGTITKEFADFLNQHYSDIKLNFELKDNVLSDNVFSVSSVEGLIKVFTKSFEAYNNYIAAKSDRQRTATNIETVSVVKTFIPKHRWDSIIFNLLEYDFYAVPNLNGGLTLGEEVITGLVPKKVVGTFGLKVDVKVEEAGKDIVVELKVVDKDGVSRTDISLQIDAQQSIKNIIEHIQKNMYIINSRPIVSDFKDEVTYIDNLFVKPLAVLLNGTYDQTVASYVDYVNGITTKLRKEFTNIRKSELQKRQNPLLAAYLSIIEDGAQPTLNDGEVVGRIAKSEVINKYFQGKVSKYNNSISDESPRQVPLDKRVSIFRAEIDGEQIDFLISEYGIDKKVIWVPLEKSFITPKVFLIQWENTGKSGVDEFNAKAKKDTGYSMAFKGVSSESYNPE